MPGPAGRPLPRTVPFRSRGARWLTPNLMRGCPMRRQDIVALFDYNLARSVPVRCPRWNSPPAAQDDCACNNVGMDYESFTNKLIADLRAHGRVTSGPMAGRPLMVLTTRGAKSGEEREAIVTYTRNSDHYVIAASKSGAPTNPAWYYNLLADPVATVEA